jgi:hypothetical protein
VHDGGSLANPVWGAPRIHGELLKLGIDVGQTTVAKYEARRRQPLSQAGRPFGSANGICSICSIPTKNITTRFVRTCRCTRTRRFAGSASRP